MRKYLRLLNLEIEHQLWKLKYRKPVKEALHRLNETETLGQLLVKSIAAHTGMLVGVSRSITPAPGYIIDHGRQRTSEIYWDAPIAFIVFLQGESVCGLGVELKGDTLIVRQMQGVRGKRLPNRLCIWPRLMLQACIDTATQWGMSEVRVVRAHACSFYRRPVFAPGSSRGGVAQCAELQKRLRRRYDGTARHMGLKEQKDYYVWKNPDYPHPA